MISLLYKIKGCEAEIQLVSGQTNNNSMNPSVVLGKNTTLTNNSTSSGNNRSAVGNSTSLGNTNFTAANYSVHAGDTTNSNTSTTNRTRGISTVTANTTAANGTGSPENTTKVNVSTKRTGQIDNDTTAYSHENFWSLWSEWSCTRNCSVREQMRLRDCVIRSKVKKECTGSAIESRPASCHAFKCPLDCEWPFFGENCSRNCEHCREQCDLFNGTCRSCYDGWDYPENGCILDRTGYEEWSPWQCSEDCSNPKLIRIRLCRVSDPSFVGEQEREPCQVPTVDSKEGDCYIGKMCPKDCPEFTWGPDCAQTCYSCIKDCNKFTGTCDACVAGYQVPEAGCLAPCSFNTYGLDCKGNCFDKCGEDCIERSNGDCIAQSNSYFAFFLVLLVIPISVFIYFVAVRKKDVDKALIRSISSTRENIGANQSKSKLTMIAKSMSQPSVKASRSSRSERSVMDSRHGKKRESGDVDRYIPPTISISRGSTNLINKRNPTDCGYM
nr:cell death abnormality protein 1-like [Biomphalaria glabrata]